MRNNVLASTHNVLFPVELIRILIFIKTGLGVLDFYHSDWLNGARLSAHTPAVTKYEQ